MKKLIITVLSILTFSIFAHAPIEHDPIVSSLELYEVRELIQSYRQTGNDAYLETAWNLMQTELPTNASAKSLLTYAILSQSRHQFDVARKFVVRALALDASNNEAWLLLASIHLVVGRIEPARNACGHLKNASILITVTCFARIALADGKAEVAYPKLAKLLMSAAAQYFGATTLDIRAWAESVAGDLSSASHLPKQAIDHYRRSLTHLDQVQVKAALADVLLADRQAPMVVDLIDHHEAALPLKIRRLIALKTLSRSHETEEDTTNLNEAFTRWIELEDWLHAREMCRFYLDVLPQPDLAKKLAIHNIKMQKELEDVRLLQRTRCRTSACKGALIARGLPSVSDQF